MTKKRLRFIDIAKGICIILIVWAHSGGLFSYPLLMLTVPCFFIISGYLHNTENDFFTFLRKKLFRLYIPFICCNLFLPLLTLIKRYNMGLDIKPNIIYITKIILTLNKDGFLFGATWFLGSLFFISILIKILEIMFKNKKFKYLFIGIISFFIILISETVLNMESGLRRTLIGMGFYIVGLYCSLYGEKINKIKHIAIALFVPLIFLSWRFAWKFGYDSKSILNLLSFALISLFFTILIIHISKRFENCKVEILSYIGERTLAILLWQFVFFEIINIVLLKINGMPLSIIEQLPHVICKSQICILVYFCAGLLGPLVISFLYKKIVLKLSK